MTDCGTPMRPSDSWSSTEVRSLQHTHMWTIKGFSQCECRYLETAVRIKDSTNVSGSGSNASLSSTNGLPGESPNFLTFKIRLHPQGNKESNKDFCFFQVFSCLSATKFKAKFSVYNTRNEEVPATVYTGTQQLNGYFEYIRRDLLINHIQPTDEIQLLLNLTIVSDTITKNSQNTSAPSMPEPRPYELARDLELMFEDNRHTDFTIVCRSEKESRELPVHKVVLCARSPVFSAMLEPHTEEAQKAEVHYEDIDFEVMREMLFYMYSGRSPKLQQMALDLLAVADRFQLIGLKEMADLVLRNGLSVDNVCRNLVLADMHNAFDLKNDALRFIAQYSNAVIATDGWHTMVKEHPLLVTEVVAAMGHESRLATTSGSSSSSCTNTSTIEPLAKRSRYDAS